MTRALEVIAQLRTRAGAGGHRGNRQYNNGWHTAMDLDNMLLFRRLSPAPHFFRKESRGASSATNFPDKDPEWGKYNIAVQRGGDRRNACREAPISRCLPAGQRCCICPFRVFIGKSRRGTGRLGSPCEEVRRG